MRVLAVGDIHGCTRALDALLRAVAPRPADVIVTLGDYVDRGPDTRGTLDRLVALHATGRHVALRGNHDQMMLDARNWPLAGPLWLACGGNSALVSYGSAEPDEADLERVPDEHWRFLEEDCVNWYETETHLFVHANLCPDLPMAEQPDYMLLWERLDGPVAHESGKTLICGHTRQRDGRPANYGTAVCIDTGVYGFGGWLTCLDVTSGRLWQANQRGKVREGWLEEADEAGA